MLLFRDVPAFPLTFHGTGLEVMSTATLSRPLSDRIHEALTTSPHVPGRQVRVEAADGHVVLTGNVRSFFQKQMAQEAIRRVDGVERIENLLEVNWA
jgi:osmotically-inducible protein OsmY